MITQTPFDIRNEALEDAARLIEGRGRILKAQAVDVAKMAKAIRHLKGDKS